MNLIGRCAEEMARAAEMSEDGEQSKSDRRIIRDRSANEPRAHNSANRRNSSIEISGIDSRVKAFPPTHTKGTGQHFPDEPVIRNLLENNGKSGITRSVIDQVHKDIRTCR